MSEGGQADLPIQTGLGGQTWGASHPPADNLRGVLVVMAETQKSKHSMSP